MIRRSRPIIAGLALALCMTLAPAGAGLLDGAPREAVTSGIRDAVPISPWLALYLKDLRPTPTRSLSLPAGYYRLRLQSYCLLAGAYGPTKGAGYLLAPFKGDQAGLIRSILERSVAHPEIDQSNIQRLLWGIEAYTKFDDYSADFQQQVRPLLTAGEISSMNADKDAVKNAAKGILGAFVPSRVNDVISEVQSWRQQLSDPSLPYFQLEQLAVLRGQAPIGEGSREVSAGPWSYAGNGAYIRFFPESYTTTDVEIFKIPSYRIALDSIGRVTKLVSGGYSVEATYAKYPDVIRFKGLALRSWRFKTVRLTGPKAGQQLVIRDRGWVLDSRDVRYSPHGDSVHGSTALIQAQVFASVQLPTLRIADTGDVVVHGVDRVWDAYGKLGAAESARKAAGPGDEAAAKEAGEELTGTIHLAGGLRDILAGDPLYWVVDTLAKSATIVAGAAAVLNDGSPAASKSDESNWDYGPQLAQPANTSQQRLGVSGRGAL